MVRRKTAKPRSACSGRQPPRVESIERRARVRRTHHVQARDCVIGTSRGLHPPGRVSRARIEFNPQGGATGFSSAKTPTVIPFNCTVLEGETVRQDLDLRAFEPCELRGVLRVNGAPARDWVVSAWPGASTIRNQSTPPSRGSRPMAVWMTRGPPRGDRERRQVAHAGTPAADLPASRTRLAKSTAIASCRAAT